MRQRMLAALLALALGLGLTACGEPKENAPAELAFVSAPSYTAEDVLLPVDTGELFGSCTGGASI